MTRVEWSALGGDEVETVLANLMYNHDGRSVRVRPAQGDYGIDILVPATAAPEPWDVYQIKKFAANLTPSQKRQIEKSFERALVGLVHRGVPVNDWYLVTPLDPTLENLLDWFAAMPSRVVASMGDRRTDLELSDGDLSAIATWLESPSRRIEWKGLPFCESLVSDHPHVVDYYLHGGRQRLADSVASLASLIGTSQKLSHAPSAGTTAGPPTSALMEPGQVVEHLDTLSRVLDTDPHYRYAFSVDPVRPDVPAAPRLVAATQQSFDDGRWLTFKIFERSAQSLDERPIPLDLEFAFDDADSAEDKAAFEVWLKYGRPTNVPAKFSADLPGGLGISGSSGRVQLLPADAEPHKIRLRVKDADGLLSPHLTYTCRRSAGVTGTGYWVEGTDDSQLVTVEMLFDLETAGAKISFNLQPLAGRRVSGVVDAVHFAAALGNGGTLEIAAEYGPFAHFCAVSGEAPISPGVRNLATWLSDIQEVTAVPIVVPDTADMPAEHLSDIRRAASLIGGQIRLATWERLTVDTLGPASLDVRGHYQLAVLEPLSVVLNGETVMLGTLRQEVDSAIVERVADDKATFLPYLNDTVRYTFEAEPPPDTPSGQRRVQARVIGVIEKGDQVGM